ncbi:MAG: NAD(P)/FAD-dependent oxidoreductase [Acidobacteria bacterium]|nr:NAD(P)/FAD-dependent oxidoreductase [Acidobacteriota bacterium]
MAAIEEQYDVIVVGGGPAGATVATLVAEAGHNVLLLERSAEPQFKVGESLMPATYWSLKRLGVLERVRATAFPKKWSVQFFNHEGVGSRPFYFHEFSDEESSQTWQVLRSEFDEILLDNAVEKGVAVQRGVSVRRVLFDGERARGARLRRQDGSQLEVGARVVVDATGQSALLARQLGIRDFEPNLRNVSYYTHYEGARLDDGIDAGATLILRTADRQAWFWFIPLPDERASVGVVGPVESLVEGRVGNPQTVFAEELAKCPRLEERLVDARQLTPMKAIRDFSYYARQVAGEGWVLVGDAFGFIDPIYSSGVFLALKSGEMAADAIVEALAADAPTAANLGSFEDELRRGTEALRQLVYAYYDHDFSFARFLERHPEYRRHLIEMLVGNVYRMSFDGFIEALAGERRRSSSPARVSS